MASSRWKRFAFFERQSLAIPDAVAVDLALANNDATIDFIVTTAALPAHTKPKVATEESPTAVSAMWSSLTACHPISDASVDAVQLKSQGQLTSSMTTTSLLDGLVVSFAATPSSSRIHCFDLTVRCNPQSSSSVSEELDGWRGYWTPFSQTILRQLHAPTSSTEALPAFSAGISAIASCRIPTSSRSSHSALHLACLGRHNELVVWEDPHLYLSCRVPLHDTAESTAAVLYTVPMSSKWNATHDGEACVLDIAPGIVAVGTTTGVVLLYSYNPTPTAAVTLASSKNPHSSRHLRPYVRIPAPPVSDVQVVSVTLSRNAHVFVSYQARSASTLGLCCYDLPPPAATGLAAPLARYDLDGRSVSRRPLVDSYTRRHGGRVLTVVSGTSVLVEMSYGIYLVKRSALFHCL